MRPRAVVGSARSQGRRYDSSRHGVSDSDPSTNDCIDFLSLLSEPKRRGVLAGSRMVRYEAGTEAYLPQQPDFAIVVQQGLFRIYVAGGGGRQATAYYIHAGQLMGKGVVSYPATNTHMQAVTDAVATSIDVELLRSLVQADVEVCLAVLTYYHSLLAHSTRIIGVRSLGDVTERLAFDLLDRACANQLKSGRLVVRVSQQELADSIGSVREVVARSLRKLRDERIVATGPSVVRVLDVERLEAIAREATF
jgi:CRP/FNR family cyclic AMP-dependent transcriptional regulator